MKPRLVLAASLLALAACATQPAPSSLEKARLHAVQVIQMAQREATKALDAKTITVDQDVLRQATLAKARRDVLNATNESQINDAAKAAGVQL